MENLFEAFFRDVAMECLILRNETAGEADVLVTVLVRDGRRREALAKSAKRMPSKLRAGILPFTITDATFAPGRFQWHLRSAQPLLSFPELRTSREALAAVAAFAAMLAEGATEVPDPLLYADAARTIRDLHTAVCAREAHSLLVRRAAAMWLRTLSHLGFAPVLDRCSSCGSRDALSAFSPAAGGMLCGPCASSHPDSRAVSSAGVSALRSRLIPRSSGDVRALLRFLAGFCANHLPAAAPSVRGAVAVLLAVS